MQRTLVAALLAAAVSVVVFFSARTIAFRDLDFWAYDFLVNHGGYAPQSRAVVVVDFDDETFRTLNQYPIPRKAFADVIARVAASGPRVIGLDLFVSEARRPEEDAAFRRAVADAGNVVLASQVAGGGIPAVRPMPLFCEPEETAAPSGFCKDATDDAGGALGYAFVNLPVESDGFVRRFFLFSNGPQPALSFAATLAQQYAGRPIEPLRRDSVRFLDNAIPFADPADRTIWIGAWRPDLVTKVSAIDLLDPSRGRVHDFHDKLVLIGQSHDAARDLFQTPLFRPDPGPGRPRLRVPGVELHAAAIETLLTGRTVKTVARTPSWVLIFAVSLIAAYLVLWLDLGPATLAVSALLLVIYAVAQSAFSWRQLWIPYASMMLATLASVPAALGYRFIQETLLRSAATREREQIMGLFGRYVSPEVAQEIWTRREEVVLAGEQRVATVLFSDIRGFTAMTAGKPSQDVLRWLNDYLTEMDEVIRAHGGFLNKFIGDGIMVLFGVPLSEGVEEDAARAVRAALAMIACLEERNRDAGPLTAFGPVRIGVGLHTGPLTCGNVGSSSRLEYSVIGETVNLASRLESLTKDLHAAIVMSQATADAIRGRFPDVRDLGETAVRGFAGKIHLYTIERSMTKGGNA